MNNELLPCPFCGGKVRPAVERPMGHGDMESRIVCHCGLKYTSNAPCEALERCWNRRAYEKPASAPGYVLHMGDAMRVFNALKVERLARNVDGDNFGVMGAVNVEAWSTGIGVTLEMQYSNGGCTLIVRSNS